MTVYHRVAYTLASNVRVSSIESGRVDALWYGERMKIDDTEYVLIKILEFDPEG